MLSKDSFLVGYATAKEIQRIELAFIFIYLATNTRKNVIYENLIST